MKLKIQDVVRETPDAISIHFKQPFFGKIKYKPGQFLTLLIDVDGKTYKRAYSLNSAPYLDKTLAVTVKRVKDGKVSNRLFETVKPGDSIEVMKPMGNFIFEAARAVRRHFVLFAGGSGITPLISITKSILFFEPQSLVSLYYANVDEGAIIFSRKIRELQEQFPDRFHVRHILENPTAGWTEDLGRLDTEKVMAFAKRVSAGSSAEEREYYICGPSGMMEVVKEGLGLLQVPEERVHLESFTAPAASPRDQHGEAQITFAWKKREHRVNVLPGKNILDAVLDEGINVPYSCLSGICGTCKCRMNSGKVKMTETGGLKPEEAADGYILPCVSYPDSDELSLEF